jgi:signal transduction histidine kinase
MSRPAAGAERFRSGTAIRVRELFEQNETIILFGEGLVFFSLGFAVWLQRRRATRLTLSSSLIWFASFAFVEALAVWGYVFVPIQATYLDAEIVDGLVILRGIVQTAAFLFLVQFGIRLLEAPRGVRTVVTTASLTVWGVILGAGVVLAGALGWSVLEWEAFVVGGARYLLLLPGAALSAVGLWRQRRELSEAGMTGIRPYAAAAAAALLIYAVLGGLIVEQGPFGPQGVATADGWFSATALPIAALRGLAGLALCVLAVKLLEIFDVEAKQRLEDLDRARAVAEERTRFRRDLHDGTIQSIYAAGLHLESLALTASDPAIRPQLRAVVAELNEVSNGIRAYITDLAVAPATPEGVAVGLEEQARTFGVETGLDIRFRVEGTRASGPLPPEAGPHLEQILRESLANVARHAEADAVDVTLRFAADELELRVRDDGQGHVPGAPDEGCGNGLRNMRERARRLGGRITLGPAKGGGTAVSLSVPLDSEEPAAEPAAGETFTEVTT